MTSYLESVGNVTNTSKKMARSVIENIQYVLLTRSSGRKMTRFARSSARKWTARSSRGKMTMIARSLAGKWTSLIVVLQGNVPAYS